MFSEFHHLFCAYNNSRSVLSCARHTDFTIFRNRLQSAAQPIIYAYIIDLPFRICLHVIIVHQPSFLRILIDLALIQCCGRTTPFRKRLHVLLSSRYSYVTIPPSPSHLVFLESTRVIINFIPVVPRRFRTWALDMTDPTLISHRPSICTAQPLDEDMSSFSYVP